MTSLSGKVALVTGASIGIGQAVTERLVKLGMKVIGCAPNESALKGVANKVNNVGPGEMLPVKCDLTNESQVLDMFKVIEEKFGKLHVCVNNAGLGHDAPLLSGKTKVSL